MTRLLSLPVLVGALAFGLGAGESFADARPELVATDSVSVVEVNRLYDEDGKRVFTQAIFRVWNPVESCHAAAAWKLANEPDIVQPVGRGKHRQSYLFFDSKSGLPVRINCQAVRHTHTQYDPEIEHRKELPTEHRRGIIGKP